MSLSGSGGSPDTMSPGRMWTQLRRLRVQAQEVGRRGGRFWAKDVKRFEDKAKELRFPPEKSRATLRVKR
jgi:hypothetical protein